MKKILLTLGVIGLVAGAAPAAFSAQTSCVMSCSKPYDMSNKFVGGVTKVTGLNFVSTKAAESILKKEVTKNASGKFKVSVDSYSVSDLKNGRFKGMEIHGENVVAEGVHVSALDVKTLCDFNYISYDKKSKKAVFKEDFPLFYSASFSENDLNNTMKASGYTDILKQVSNLGKAFSLFEVKSSQVKVKNNQFIYVLKVALPFMNTTQDVAIVSDLKVQNGKICFTNPQLMHKYFAADFGKIANALNYLNPLDFSLRIFEDKDADMKVQNINIVNNMININGTINVSKDI